MRLYSAALEQRILLGILENRNPKTRRMLLANTAPDTFGTDWGKEVRQRIDDGLQRGQDLPRAKTFADTPSLSDAAQKFIRAKERLRLKARVRKYKDFEQDVLSLKDYKRVRAANEGLLKAAETLKNKVSHQEIEDFATILENTLSEVREDLDQQPMVHYGRGQTRQQAKDMYRRLTDSAAHRFVSSGYDALDLHLGGGHARGNLVVISAPRKGGKSTLALNMAINQFLRAHLNVLFLSLEMPLEDVEQRIAAKEGNLPFGLVRNPDNLSTFQRKKIQRFCKELYRSGKKNGARLTIWPVTDAAFTPEALYRSVRGMKYDVIYVDYLTLFHKKKQDLWEMQMEYSRLLKQMAKRLNCVIVTLTQLNANESVKYGTSVEENLDTWFRWPWGEDEAETGEAEIKLALCRHAPTASFPSRFELDKMKITIFPPKSAESDKKTNRSQEAKELRGALKRGEI